MQFENNDMFTQTTSIQSMSNPTMPTKKTYHRPALVVYGNIRELTLSSLNGDDFDGADPFVTSNSRSST